MADQLLNKNVRRHLAAVALLAVGGLAACDTNAPEQPGGQLERDGTSQVITDPQGVANEIGDDEFESDVGEVED